MILFSLLHDLSIYIHFYYFLLESNKLYVCSNFCNVYVCCALSILACLLVKLCIQISCFQLIVPPRCNDSLICKKDTIGRYKPWNENDDRAGGARRAHRASAWRAGQPRRPAPIWHVFEGFVLRNFYTKNRKCRKKWQIQNIYTGTRKEWHNSAAHCWQPATHRCCRSVFGSYTCCCGIQFYFLAPAALILHAACCAIHLLYLWTLQSAQRSAVLWF